jgi:regulatory protein
MSVQAQEQMEFRGGSLTALSVQKGSPDRLSLFVDDQFAFGARREVVLRHKLKKGMEVTVEQLQAVWRDEECYKARDAAVKYLGLRTRSCKEMSDYLARKEFDEVIVAETLQWLVGYGYLDDEQFARQWVDSRMRSKPRGKALLRFELKQKGVSREEIEGALSGFEDGNLEMDAAMSVLGKKIGRKQIDFTRENQQKLAQFLARRGFSGSVIWAAIRRFQSVTILDND